MRHSLTSVVLPLWSQCLTECAEWSKSKECIYELTCNTTCYCLVPGSWKQRLKTDGYIWAKSDRHQKSWAEYFNTCLRPVWSQPPSSHSSPPCPPWALPCCLQWFPSPSGPDAKRPHRPIWVWLQQPCNHPSLSAQICREVWLEIARGRSAAP